MHLTLSIAGDFQIGDSILYRRDPNSYLTGTVEWLGIKDGAQIAGIRLVSLPSSIEYIWINIILCEFRMRHCDLPNPFCKQNHFHLTVRKGLVALPW